jgi:hypothetical protein
MMIILYGERQTVIKWQCIAALAKVGQIEQITNGQWLFQVLLAPTPHQQIVYSIEDFVWRFTAD